MDIWTTSLTLFFIMDPLGNVPIFLSLLKDFDKEKRNKILRRELIIALFALVFFLYFGGTFLKVLGVSKDTIGISGGIVLFLIAIKMIFPIQGGNSFGGTPGEEPYIVPLAIPLIAGPSTLASILLFDKANPDNKLIVLSSIGIAWVLSAIILAMSSLLFKVLKNKGLAAIERLMGMILIMVAVEMFLSGVKSFFNV